MPFCSQCGKQVGVSDVYCAKCGARQPVAPHGYGSGSAGAPPPGSDALAALHPRTASVLCYVPGIGWIVSIIVLASGRFRNDLTVRFHAFQGLYLFVAWLIADWVLRPAFYFMPWSHFEVYRIAELVLLGMSIFMMLKAGQNEAFALPIFGELAQRSAAGD
jgi:uncharacterized membrane protein